VELPRKGSWLEPLWVRRAPYADTKRDAVAQFVEHVRAGTAVPRVVANARGQVNKVVFRPDGGSTPGWYCYTSTALDAPTEL
jgi:hypothetical protein